MNVTQSFDDIYSIGQSSRLGNVIFNIVEKEMLCLVEELDISKSSKIIDIGCGIGRTMQAFKDCGYSDIIGIDSSINAIIRCKNQNLEVYKEDAKKTNFADDSFDVVFEEGLLEHFKDFQPFVDEMCRISKRYAILIQPNNFSIQHRLMDKISSDKNVDEIPYKPEDFISAFKKNGFILASMKQSFMNLFWTMIFMEAKP